MKEINIAEILNDCPKGTRLYSPMWGECTLREVHADGAIEVLFGRSHVSLFLSNGKYSQTGEVVLFPSKDNRDWSTFKAPHKHFEPFQKVLVKCREWVGDFYSHFCEKNNAHVTISGFEFNDDDIIPYSGNESLLGKEVEP